MKTNYHTHTKLCRHARGTSEDYILEAIRNHLSIIGMSDHGPFPDNPFGLRMMYEELLIYLEEINAQKQIHQSEITIYSGLEIEYLPNQHPYYENLLQDIGFDYLALGEHIYTTEQGELKNIFMAESTFDYIDYANSTVQGMKSGYFRFLVHPDIMFINNFAWDENCERASDIILSAAAKYNFILEFNANGLRRQKQTFCDGERYPYPDNRFWDKIRGSKIPVLVNSDCHNPLQLWDNYMEMAHIRAAELSLNIVEQIF